MRTGDPNNENLGEMVSETQGRNSLHRQSFLQVLFKCGESVDVGEDFGERVECVVRAQAEFRNPHAPSVGPWASHLTGL